MVIPTSKGILRKPVLPIEYRFFKSGVIHRLAAFSDIKFVFEKIYGFLRSSIFITVNVPFSI